MNIKSTLFKKEWEQMEDYFYPRPKDKEKRHTHEEANFYYSQLKDLPDEIFLQTIKNIYNNCKYFPNIAEIREQVPNGQETKMSQWKESKSEPLNEEDKKWCRGFYKKYCDTEEECQRKILEVGLVD